MTTTAIVVTPGETTLIEAFHTAEIPILVEPLLIGDALIRNSVTGQPVYIFERKSKGDLDASIKDGRYHEQKSRLFETGLQRKNIVYVIENLSAPKDALSKKRVWNAICHSQHRDGVTVFQTKTPAETAQYIFSLAEAVSKFSDNPQEETKEITVDIKKKKVAKEDWFKYSLSLIPGCSLLSAAAIVDRFPSFTILRQNLENQGVQCLSEIKYGLRNQRVSKKVQQAIHDYILQEDVPRG